MDSRLALVTGAPIPIPECKITVHQPTLEEISYLGEEDFFIGMQTLTLNKSMFVEGKDVLDDISNFQIFMMVMSEKETRDKKTAVLQLLTILFPEHKALLTPRSLLLNRGENESVMIDETNFDALQSVLRLISCANEGSMDQQAFNPANEQAKEIAEKLMRGRQRVAAQNGSSNSSIFSQYLSSLAVGLQQDLNSLKKLTMFQLYDLMERFVLHTNWDIDIRTRLAGGKPDSQPDNWMKNIH